MKPAETTLSLNKLYRCQRKLSGSEDPVIEAIGGTIDVYGSIKQPTAAPANMHKAATGFTGIDKLGPVQSYLYVTGTATSAIVTGVSAIEVV